MPLFSSARASSLHSLYFPALPYISPKNTHSQVLLCSPLTFSTPFAFVFILHSRFVFSLLFVVSLRFPFNFPLYIFPLASRFLYSSLTFHPSLSYSYRFTQPPALSSFLFRSHSLPFNFPIFYLSYFIHSHTRNDRTQNSTHNQPLLNTTKISKNAKNQG